MVIKTLKSNGIFLILPIVRDPSTSEREHVFSFLSSSVDGESLSDSRIVVGSGVDVGFTLSMLKCFSTLCM